MIKQITDEVIVSSANININENDLGLELEFDYVDIYDKLNNYRSKNTSNPDNITIEMPDCKLFGIPVIFKTKK
jgi:hypothetical protein